MHLDWLIPYDMRIKRKNIDQEYYYQVFIGWLVKTGLIDYKPPIHNKPELFGLTEKDAINMRIRALRADKHELEAEYAEIKGLYLRGERPYGYLTMNSLQERIDKLSKAIHFNRQRLNGDITNQPFDLTALKQIPLDRITKINANGFFQTNPFRTENEPSNSLHWNKNNNTWYDFASGQHGDSVDLYMKINNISFRQACKEMQSL